MSESPILFIDQDDFVSLLTRSLELGKSKLPVSETVALKKQALTHVSAFDLREDTHEVITWIDMQLEQPSEEDSSFMFRDKYGLRGFAYHDVDTGVYWAMQAQELVRLDPDFVVWWARCPKGPRVNI